jgi:hypothetical protein
MATSSLLTGLPKEFDVTVDRLSSELSLTFEAAVRAILEKDEMIRQQKRTKASAFAAIIPSMTALAATVPIITLGQKKGHQEGARLHCTYCSKPNHTEDECFSKHPDKKAAHLKAQADARAAKEASKARAKVATEITPTKRDFDEDDEFFSARAARVVLAPNTGRINQPPLQPPTDRTNFLTGSLDSAATHIFVTSSTFVEVSTPRSLKTSRSQTAGSSTQLAAAPSMGSQCTLCHPSHRTSSQSTYSTRTESRYHSLPMTASYTNPATCLALGNATACVTASKSASRSIEPAQLARFLLRVFHRRAP